MELTLERMTSDKDATIGARYVDGREMKAELRADYTSQIQAVGNRVDRLEDRLTTIERRASQ